MRNPGQLALVTIGFGCQSYSSMTFYCKINTPTMSISFKDIHHLLKCKMRFSPLIWHLHITGHLWFVYELGTMWSQTKACIAKSSCDFCTLLRYYVVYTGTSLLTFQDTVGPIFRGREIQRWERSTAKVTDTVFRFWDFFLKKHNVLKAGSFFHFQGKKQLTCWTP